MINETVINEGDRYTDGGAPDRYADAGSADPASGGFSSGGFIDDASYDVGDAGGGFDDDNYA